MLEINPISALVALGLLSFIAISVAYIIFKDDPRDKHKHIKEKT